MGAAAPTSWSASPGSGIICYRVNGVVLAITAILVVLAAINAIFITQATVLNAQQPSALARTFGATPRQVSSGFTVAHLILALIAGILSLPARTLVYRVARRRQPHRGRRPGPPARPDPLTPPGSTFG